MNDSDNPRVAAERARDKFEKTAARFEKSALDTPMPDAMRAVAEKNVAQTHEVYERSKDALEAALETLERSFDALGQGTIALNHKVIDIAQRNINSGFDLAVSLTAAKNLAEVIELQAAYWRKQFGALADQAKEVRALSSQVTADVAKQVKEQVARGVDDLRKAS
ncbi:MAG: phasin family protein [Methyloceanibacter sp.]